MKENIEVKIITCTNKKEQDILKEINYLKNQGYSITDEIIEDNGNVIMLSMQKINK